MNAPADGAVPAAPRLVQSLRRLGLTLIGIAQTRAELAAIELAEEKERLITVVLSGLAGLLLLFLALVTLTLLVVVHFWDHGRWQVLTALTLLYGGAGTWLLLRVRQGLEDAPTPFSATAAELARDRDALRLALGATSGADGADPQRLDAAASDASDASKSRRSPDPEVSS